MRRQVIYLVVSLAVAFGALLATVVAGNTPVLGLDLRGGVSVVLSPVGNFEADSLDVAVDVIRSRVDSLGVAEPEISRQGDDIVVDLPGVKDRCRAEQLVGQTAELRFRPVLIPGIPSERVQDAAAGAPTTTTTPGATTTTTRGDEAGEPATTTEPPPATEPPTTIVPEPPTTTAPEGEGDAASATTAEPSARRGGPDECEPVEEHTAIGTQDAAALAAVASCDPQRVAALDKIPTSTREDDRRNACVVLPDKPGGGDASRYYLGPTGLTGKVVDSARAEFVSGQGWTVRMELTDEGGGRWDDLAREQFHRQVAITLDSIVQSAPTIQPDEAVFSSFGGTAVISGRFTQGEAEDLAKLINYGALPVRLEKVTVQNVSPTLGQDQLDAAVMAGILGIALVALYVVFFYRLLGLVVIAGILLAAALLYSLVAHLGQSVGLALTIAGVTGLVVSLGVTIDSYIVYFERLKDDVREGSTVRACVDRAFVHSWRTILAANLVSLIGALILYWLAIGSVRGFAFFLALSTVFDLLVAYFFMHPLVSLLSRKPELVRMRGVGIAAGLDAPGVTA